MSEQVLSKSAPLGITDVVLRDAHQSLFATRLRLDDMLPIAEKLDQVGFWSLESWGGATFDACIRYLGRTLGADSSAESGNAQYASANAVSGSKYFGLPALC